MMVFVVRWRARAASRRQLSLEEFRATRFEFSCIKPTGDVGQAAGGALIRLLNHRVGRVGF